MAIEWSGCDMDRRVISVGKTGLREKERGNVYACVCVYVCVFVNMYLFTICRPAKEFYDCDISVHCSQHLFHPRHCT